MAAAHSTLPAASAWQSANPEPARSASEWAAAEFVLPVQYGVLLACLVGIADQSRAGQFFHNLVIDEPEPEPEPEPVEPEPVVEVRKPFTIDDLRKHQSIKGLLQMDTPAGVC